MLHALMVPALALMLMTQSPPQGNIDADAVSAALDPAKAPGTILIARGDKIVFERAIGTIAPESETPHELGQVWRWASVTKQITATIAMQEAAAGRLDLDAPIIRYLPDSKAPLQTASLRACSCSTYQG